MTGSLIFWAQALDNTSPDHLKVRGKALLANDEFGRQQAVSDVTRVIKSGSRVFERQGLRLTADSRNYVLELPSNERDQVGRIAPIVCYGDTESLLKQGSESEVLNELQNFAEEISRALSDGHLEIAMQAFDVLKKKSKTKHKILIGLIIVMLLVVVAILIR